MRIVIAGGSGFLGQHLVRAWRGDGHDVRVLTRRARQPGDIEWAPGSDNERWASSLDGAAVVVNLAGEGIADKRWTAERKSALRDSRIGPARALASAILRCHTAPTVFISASGAGFYGVADERAATEESPSGSDFLASICQAWEKEAMTAAAVTRVVVLRTGVVLARDGGALPRIALPFHFFAGGRIGSGEQTMSWIHVADAVELVRWAASHAAVTGPLNLTAPEPVSNAEFTRALGRALHRPALFPVPAIALRTLLGSEMADLLLLRGQRVLPAKAQRLGYQFRFRNVDSALRDIFHP